MRHETTIPSYDSPIMTAKKAPIIVKTKNHQLEIQSEDNLLDALLESGHNIDYQCRSGYCGSCRIKTNNSGQVSYDDFPLAHLDHDEILPCCCRVIEPLELDISKQYLDTEQQGHLFSPKDE